MDVEDELADACDRLGGEMKTNLGNPMDTDIVARCEIDGMETHIELSERHSTEKVTVRRGNEMFSVKNPYVLSKGPRLFTVHGDNSMVVDFNDDV